MIFWVEKQQPFHCNGNCEREEQRDPNTFEVAVFYCLRCHWNQLANRSCTWTAEKGGRCGQTVVDQNGLCRFHEENWSAAIRVKRERRWVMLNRKPYVKNWEKAIFEDEMLRVAQRVQDKVRLVGVMIEGLIDVALRNPDWVYFIRAGKYVKIGHSISPKSRLQALKSNPQYAPHDADTNNLELLLQVPGGRRLEQRLHMILSKHRVSGEWFRWNKAVRSVFDDLANIDVNDVNDLARLVDAS